MKKSIVIIGLAFFLSTHVAFATGKSHHNKHDGDTTNNTAIGVKIGVDNTLINKNIGINVLNADLSNQNYNNANAGAIAINGPQNQKQSQNQSTNIDNSGNNVGNSTSSSDVTNTISFDNIGSGDATAIGGDVSTNLGVEMNNNSPVSVNINNPQQFPALHHNPADIVPVPLGPQMQHPSTADIEISALLNRTFYKTYGIDSYQEIGPLEFKHGLTVTIIPKQKGFAENDNTFVINSLECEGYSESLGDPEDECFGVNATMAVRPVNDVTIEPFVPGGERKYVYVAVMNTTCSACPNSDSMMGRARQVLKEKVSTSGYTKLYELYITEYQVAVTGTKHTGTNFGGTASGSWIANSLAAVALSGTAASGTTEPFLATQGVTTYYFAESKDGIAIDFEVLLGTKKETPPPMPPQVVEVKKVVQPKKQEKFVPENVNYKAYNVLGLNCDRCKEE